MSNEMRVRIVSDGTDTHVYDTETGRELPCRSVKFFQSWMKGGNIMARVNLIVRGGLDYLGPATVDEEDIMAEGEA